MTVGHRNFVMFVAEAVSRWFLKELTTWHYLEELERKDGDGYLKRVVCWKNLLG